MELNKIEIGYCYLCLALILTILCYTGLYLGGFYSFNANDFGVYNYKYLLEKYLFYFSIMSAQIGYFYIYGDIEREFWKITLSSILLFFIMDLTALFSLLSY